MNSLGNLERTKLNPFLPPRESPKLSAAEHLDQSDPEQENTLPTTPKLWACTPGGRSGTGAGSKGGRLSVKDTGVSV